MLNVPIQALPNQSFSISLENNTYNITIATTSSGDNGIIIATIIRNDVVIVEGARCVAGFPIIPSQYQEDGNFIFFTQNQQLPLYTQFNITHFLTYLTEAELETYRTPNLVYGATPTPSSPTVPTVTAASFNPLGALPLRFAPQGYVEVI